MNIKEIKIEEDYYNTLNKIGDLMASEPNSCELFHLEVLTSLVEVYKKIIIK